MVFGLLVSDQGERSFEALCLCSIGVPLPLECLLLLEKAGIRGLLLGQQFQFGIQFCPAVPGSGPGPAYAPQPLPGTGATDASSAANSSGLCRAGHGREFPFLSLEFRGFCIGQVF